MILFSDNSEIIISNLKKTENEIKQSKIYSSSISIGIFSGVNIGFGEIKKSRKYTKESRLIFHISSVISENFSSDVYAIGIYGQTNYFKSPDREGSFFRTDIGIDYCQTRRWGGSPGGSSSSELIRFLFPNIAFGVGQSIKIGENNFFRLSFDFGIKMVICNLNLEYIF